MQDAKNIIQIRIYFFKVMQVVYIWSKMGDVI